MNDTDRQIFMRDLLESGLPHFTTHEDDPFVSLAVTWGKGDRQAAGFFFDASGSAMCGTVVGHPTPDVVQGLVEKGKGKGYG